MASEISALHVRRSSLIQATAERAWNILLRALPVVAAMLALSSLTEALEPGALQGEYQLAGPLDHKGSPGEGRSHLYLSLTSDAAKRLYATLTEDAREDPCTGYKVKGRGNVACYEIKPNHDYLCSFSIDLEHGAVEAGLGGCI